MKTLTFLFVCLITSPVLFAQTKVPSKAAQMKAAVMAAPEEKRDGVMIYGFAEDGEFIVLRKGTNDLICLADNPEQKGFNVACYYKDLDAFMARGRELKKEGKSFKEIFDTREEEVKSGKLKIPQNSSLYVLSGGDEVFNPETGEVTGANLRSVVYIPFATSESTGLPLKPAAPGMPWIMDPGTHRAHIMITPPAKN
ncbi:MAG: hypothetical protein KDC93_04460 [Cyclobacteriaceae bacterium]|jgi:hypothetical protein|nr:hypothetical protein [Cyclobacteriaceae bacterium]